MSEAKIMTLENFAKRAGVTFIECAPEWGGRVGYRLADYPNMSFCGYRTQKAAIDSWMRDNFGESTAKALKSLLKPSAKATEAQ